LWTQYVQAKKAGAIVIYQAMFDEIDEGTARCGRVSRPGQVADRRSPIREPSETYGRFCGAVRRPSHNMSRFVIYEGLPSDHYLWLTGMGARLLRGEIKPTDAMPLRH